jgi:myo-inositol-1(or 4)-monophosphatase
MIPERRELEAFLEGARRVSKEAGELVLAGWRTGAAVHKKGPVDLVTEYDLRSEELVRRRLLELFPGHVVVGEEHAAEDDASAGDLVWYVDPIDGTTNFSHGHPFFAVSLGLCFRGEPIVGVTLGPALGIEWCAARGLGATRNGVACQVARTAELGDALAATSFPYDKPAGETSNFRQFERFYRRTHGVRRCGATALDFAMTADGTYAFYWGYDCGPWDACAGAVLVEEAGGRVSDVFGAVLRPPQGGVLASNGLLHGAALDLLRQVRAATTDPLTGP